MANRKAPVKKVSQTLIDAAKELGYDYNNGIFTKNVSSYNPEFLSSKDMQTKIYGKKFSTITSSSIPLNLKQLAVLTPEEQKKADDAAIRKILDQAGLKKIDVSYVEGKNINKIANFLKSKNKNIAKQFLTLAKSIDRRKPNRSNRNVKPLGDIEKYYVKIVKSSTSKKTPTKIVPVKKNGTGGGGGEKGGGKGGGKGEHKKIPHGQSSYPSPLVTDKIPAVLKNKFKAVTTGTGGIFDYRRGAGVGIADTALNLALAGVNGIANKARIEKYVKAHGGKAKNIDFATGTFKRTQTAEEKLKQQFIKDELTRKADLQELNAELKQAQIARTEASANKDQKMTEKYDKDISKLKAQIYRIYHPIVRSNGGSLGLTNGSNVLNTFTNPKK